MRLSTTLLALCFLFLSICETQAQYKNADKIISHVRDHGNGWAFTIPGWIVRTGAKVASTGMEKEEREMVRQLSKAIKKLRLVVTEDKPEDFQLDNTMLNYTLDNEQYEPLIKIRDEQENINLWVKMEGEDLIKNIFVSVNSEKEMFLLKMKTKLSLDELTQMDFFQDYKKRELSAISKNN
jgi:hypothetical protein